MIAKKVVNSRLGVMFLLVRGERWYYGEPMSVCWIPVLEAPEQVESWLKSLPPDWEVSDATTEDITDIMSAMA